MTKLRACPFCGSSDIILIADWDTIDGRAMTIMCNHCHVMTNPEERITDSDGYDYEEGTPEYDEQAERIITIWNRRAHAYGLNAEFLQHAHAFVDELRNSPGNALQGPPNLGRLDGLLEDLQKSLNQSAREQRTAHDQHECPF